MKKKLYRYMKVADNINPETGEKFPATKKRKEFKLPWMVHGKGLCGKLI